MVKPEAMRFSIILFIFCSLQSVAQFDTDIINQWETSFQSYATSTAVKGMSVAIRSAENLWTDQYGVSAATEMINEDHLFAMGSVSKTITSATILQMAEEGLLDLDDQLFMYVGAYDNVDVTATIRQLLNHTSGIFDYTSNPAFGIDFFINPETIISPEEVVSQYVLEPDFPVGTNFNYSNTNYVLLGMIIEEVSGQTYYAEARARFNFDLNYPSFVIPPYETSPENLAHLWADIDGTGEVDVQASGFSLNFLFSGAGAAGAYAATPKDISQWARDLYSGVLLQPESMEELMEPSAFNENYGLGVILIDEFCSTSLVGHTGGIIYTTATFYDSNNGLAISIHTNDGETSANMSAIASNLFCIYSDFISSIDEVDAVESLEIYPNPFQDSFTISYELPTANTVEIEIVDQTGRVVSKVSPVRKEPGIYQEELTLELPAGIFLLRVVVDGKVSVKKIVKF